MGDSAKLTVLKNYIADLIEDLGYDITFDDIDGKAKNVMGIYFRDAGVVKSMGQIVLRRYDVTIRLHGDTVEGSQDKCDKDLETIESRLVTNEVKLTGVKILGMSVRKQGEMFGKTSNSIPVYNASYLLQYE